VFALPPLAQALTRRIVVLLLVVVVLTLASIAALVVAQDRLQRVEEDAAARQMVKTRLDLLQESWQREAENITTGIEMQRFSNRPESVRWHSLRAWLVALGENLSFDTVMVRDAAGRSLFVHGQESDELVANPPAGDAAWLFSHQNQELHAVIRAGLWLGPERGRGEIIYLQPIRPSTLQLISSDLRAVYLANADNVLQGFDKRPIPTRAGAEFELDGKHWRLIEIAIPGAGDSRLLVRLPAGPPVWIKPVLLGAAVLALTLALGIHLLLGRWARDLVRRIETLKNAALAFSDEQHADFSTSRALLREARGMPDEVGAVAETLETLMQAVALREEENRAYLETLNLLEEVVIELDRQGAIRRASAAWLRLSGGRQSDAASFHTFLHHEDAEQMRTVLETLISGEKEQLTLRARLLTQDASNLWVECRFVPLRDAAGQVNGLRGVLRDVTRTYMQEKQITEMALHDALTGLPNRVLLEDRAKMAIRFAQRTKHKIGLCFFDLDHFKQINDTLGHKAGDRLLIALTGALRARLRQADTLARWGGDEFVLLIPDMPGMREIREVVAKITEITKTPLVVDDADFAITFSMGVAVYPDDAEELDALLSQADRAMFYAKSQGRNIYQFFADMSQKGLGKKDLYIQHRLAAAIKNNEIRVWLQPLINAESGRVTGVEALARWHDPELGWVPPATFIPMAENLGLIRELGEQVWIATLSAGRTCNTLGRDLGLAVNISKRQLFMTDFTAKLVEDAARFDIPPARITLEITESIALLDVEFAAEQLNELRRAGFRIAIDDFGTGYSSLSQLHDMPVQEIKIDISFIRRIHTPQGLRIVQAIVQMATAMQLECVAEGVEDLATAELLRQIGVCTLQGFYYAKPMPTDAFNVWLSDTAAEQPPNSLQSG